MVLEETPQGVPDRVLVVYVKSPLDEAVQGLLVRSGEGHAETSLSIIGQFTFHPVLVNGHEREIYKPSLAKKGSIHPIGGKGASFFPYSG